MRAIFFSGKSSSIFDFAQLKSEIGTSVVLGVRGAGAPSSWVCSEMGCSDAFLYQVCSAMNALVSSLDCEREIPTDILVVAYDMPLFPSKGNGPFLPAELEALWPCASQDEHLLETVRNITDSVYSQARFTYVFTYGDGGPTCEQLRECGFHTPMKVDGIGTIREILKAR